MQFIQAIKKSRLYTLIQQFFEKKKEKRENLLLLPFFSRSQKKREENPHNKLTLDLFAMIF
jgi:hypothetical protein